MSVVRFASEDHARRNRDRPEQREWWRDASQHLARVVFHDAPKVHTYLGGGSDEAGFVQIIQGRTDDMERMVSLGRDQEELLAGRAPHILGRTLAEHDDRPGDFTRRPTSPPRSPGAPNKTVQPWPTNRLSRSCAG